MTQLKAMSNPVKLKPLDALCVLEIRRVSPLANDGRRFRAPKSAGNMPIPLKERQAVKKRNCGTYAQKDAQGKLRLKVCVAKDHEKDADQRAEK